MDIVPALQSIIIEDVHKITLTSQTMLSADTNLVVVSPFQKVKFDPRSLQSNPLSEPGRECEAAGRVNRFYHMQEVE